MEKRAVRLIGVVSVVLVTAYFIFQLSGFFQPDYTVQTAYMGTAYDDISANGYIIRDEMVLKQSYKGVLAVDRASGERVAKGGRIASVYSSEEELEKRLEVNKLAEKIDIYQRSLDNLSYGTSEIAEIDQKINDMYKNISSQASDGDGMKIYNEESDLSMYLNRKQAITGNEDTVKAALNSLQAEYDKKKLALSGTVSAIYASEPGCFVNTVDGLEDKLTPDVVDKLTVNDIEALPKLQFKKEDTSSVIGKLVVGYEWYFATVLNKKDLGDLKEGSAVNLRFPFALDILVPATIKSVSEDGDKCLVIISSSYVLNEINTIRNQTVQIVKSSYDGLRVPGGALRVQNNKTGVFVRRGSVIQFEPVDILVNKDQYIIIKADDSNNGVKLYDQVIVAGKNLYDGKVVN